MKHAFANYSNDLHYVTQILSCNFKAIHMQSQICSTYFIMIICSWERLGCFLCVFAKDLNLRHTWILCFNLPLERHPYLSLSLVMLLCLFFQWWIAGKLLNWSIFTFILLKIRFKWVCFFKRKNAMRYIIKVHVVDEWTLMLCRVYLWRHGRPHQFTPISKKLPLPTRLRRCHYLYTACW